MDTAHLEYTAEDLIAYKLQRAGFLIAKPKFDREGTDLIALLEVGDGAKFCRIQCKGRSLKKSPNSNVKVPEEYVRGAFCLFLYVDKGDDTIHLFCFFPKEIKKYWKRKADKKSPKKIYYSLSINKETFFKQNEPNNLIKYTFNDDKIDILKKVITRSSSPKEMELFGLINTQQEFIELTEELHGLEHVLNEIESTKESIKYLDEIIDNRTKLFENNCELLLTKLPKIIVKKIRTLKNYGLSEEEVLAEILKTKTNKVSKKILECAIPYIFGTHL